MRRVILSGLAVAGVGLLLLVGIYLNAVTLGFAGGPACDKQIIAKWDRPLGSTSPIPVPLGFEEPREVVVLYMCYPSSNVRAEIYVLAPQRQEKRR